MHRTSCVGGTRIDVQLAVVGGRKILSGSTGRSGVGERVNYLSVGLVFDEDETRIQGHRPGKVSNGSLS